MRWHRGNMEQWAFRIMCARPFRAHVGTAYVSGVVFFAIRMALSIERTLAFPGFVWPVSTLRRSFRMFSLSYCQATS